MDAMDTCNTCFGSHHTCTKVQLYHDKEWGRNPISDELIFERLCLYIFQAGLNIRVVLLKRDALKKALYSYDLDLLAALKESDIKMLLFNEHIIRNSKKLMAVMHNARSAIRIRDEYGSLNLYFEQFRGILKSHNTLWSGCRKYDELPCASDESRFIASKLKQRGMQFIGPKTVYSFLQSIRLITNHVVGCPLH